VAIGWTTGLRGRSTPRRLVGTFRIKPTFFPVTNPWAQLLTVLAAIGAAAGLAADHIISGSDALAVISAGLGYAIHASGVVLGNTATTKAPTA
jgi:hypothetical protein